MNYLDIIIIAVIGFFVIRGVTKGLIKTLTGVVSFFLALIVATSMMGMAANMLQELLNMNKSTSYILSYVLQFVGVILVCRLAGNLILKLFSITSTRWVDRTGGGIFGFFIGSMIVSAVLVAFSFFSFTERLLPERGNSYLYPHARTLFPAVYNIVIQVKPAAQTFQEITEDILSGQPRDALKRTQAGRDLLEYWENLELKKRLKR